VKLQQVKTEWGVSGGRERKRAADYCSERQSIGQKWKWHGSEMSNCQNGHLSIFSKANQWNR